MLQIINKERVKHRFLSGFKTYDEHAVVQKAMAIELISYLENTVPEKCFESVFEFGCGTGILTRLFMEKFETGRYIANDLVEECGHYMKEISPEIEFVAGDVESGIEFPSNNSLIISNATLQWIRDKTSFMERCILNLKREGIIAFSSFGPDNMIEIKTITGNGLNYENNELISRLAENQLEILYYKEERKVLTFPTVMDVLKHIKLTGTNGNSTTFWTPTGLKKFAAAYEQFLNSRGEYSLTYHPIICIGRKT
ncbi:MAG: malonyl-ACP O-methyltransferase BioC [Calditrichia bacterium]